MVSNASAEQRPTMNADQMVPHTASPPADPKRKPRVAKHGGKRSVAAPATDNDEAVLVSSTALCDAAK